MAGLARFSLAVGGLGWACELVLLVISGWLGQISLSIPGERTSVQETIGPITETAQNALANAIHKQQLETPVSHSRTNISVYGRYPILRNTVDSLSIQPHNLCELQQIARVSQSFPLLAVPIHKNRVVGCRERKKTSSHDHHRSQMLVVIEPLIRF